MKKICSLLSFAVLPLLMLAQQEQEPKDTSWKTIYRASHTIINDLVHTKLDVKFDYAKSYMYGKEWLTAKPHFYNTDSLTLDAKGMDIKEVSLVKGAAKSELKYDYDGNFLRITLDKMYKAGEQYTIFIDYVSKPDEVESKGSAAISEAKGLYFINPRGEEKNKPTQIWTQGETEANSVWMPTIDKPNQKTTEEIYMTVPAKYVTLSNGLLISQKKNTDGTRTDYWKMDLPHSTYLFFMGVGEYSIIKDSYKGKEVSYYVEKEYAPYARGIFGHTPEMIKFYSDKLGVDFPWAKYSQIVGRDYVSGAMENTTATLHQESAYQNGRELTDGNSWEDVISHELFHQWFGDYVTTESWSNITVNESMADYSETLWNEYKYGRDKADEHIQQNRLDYMRNPADAQKNLVRFYYADKEDVFDQVSYPKGGSILHMLRNYVGDDAFFKSLNLYLNTNKFKNGEAQQMRLAFEEVTGQDLNWFYNQWYFGNGHPKLKIDYLYDDAAGKATVIIEQTQNTGKIFRLPIAIDVYNGSIKKRYKVWIENKVDSFTFNYSQKPDLINVDGDKILLAEKTDNKTDANFIAQWKYAPLYLDRKEALDYFAKKNMPELANGLTDKYAPLRAGTIQKLAASSMKSDPTVVVNIEKIANTEKDKKTKAAAIRFLAKLKDSKYLSLFKNNLNDSSYSVSAAALEGLNSLDPAGAYNEAKKLNADARGALSRIVGDVMMKNATAEDFDPIAAHYDGLPFNQEKVMSTATFAAYLEKVNDLTKVKKGIDMIIKFRNDIPDQFKSFTDPGMKTALDHLAKVKGTEIDNYIKSVWK
ncbi:MAG: M1 family metallopeptidase [Ferruginibacter sp.]